MEEEKKDLKEQQQKKKIKSVKTAGKSLKKKIEKNSKKTENNLEQPEQIREKEKKDDKGQKNMNVKKRVIPIIVLTVVVCMILFFSSIFALININNNKIFSNIIINGIDLSGLTQQEAVKKMQEVTEDKLKEELTLKYNEYETTLNASQLNAKYDIEKAVNEAYNIGRAGNIISNNYAIIYTMLFESKIDLPLYYDKEALASKVKDIDSKLPGAVVQSSYYIEDEHLIIVKGTAGVKIKEGIEEEIIREIKEISKKYNIVQIQTEQTDPDKIDIEKIRNEIYKEPKDAYVTQNPTTVHAHVNGVDFKISIEEAKKIIEEDKKEYKIPLKITVPKKTIKELGKEAFPNQLANYTTRYDITNYNRSNNLAISAKKINGTVIMPGETFSYNKVVGERTIAAGYKAAGAYAGGKVIQSVGGGICQISSTLYNTALLANLEIKDRSNHAFLTGYVPASRDATVSWGTLDFQFKNTRKYPIKIEASAKNGICKISIYGIKEETEYEVVVQSKVLSYIPYTVKYVNDDTLEEGKEVVEQAGQNGCTSEAYKILKLNGKVISKTLLSKDTYDPMQRIVRRGTKQQEISNQIEANQE